MILFCCPPSVAVELLGPAALSVEVGLGPGSIAVGDFNNDGAADLAVANQFSASVSLLLGDGLGGIARRADFPVGDSGLEYEPTLLAEVEFNGDGFADLVVCGSGRCFTLLGDGLGNLHESFNVRVAVSPTSLTVADFNGDGDPDLALTGRGTYPDFPGTLDVLIGDGTGYLDRKTPVRSVGRRELSIAAADFNEDGAVDLVVASTGDYANEGALDLLLGDGSGSFASPVDLGVGDSPVDLAVSDFNGDGLADLAFAGTGASPESAGNVGVLLGDGRGGFLRSAEIGIGSNLVSIAVADLNGDGATDIVVGGYGSVYDAAGGLGVLLGDGRGGVARTAEEFVTRGLAIAVADLNGDGAEDLAWGDYSGNAVTVLQGDGLGGFKRAAEFQVGAQPTSVAVADLNGDGALDLAVANSYSDSVSILMGDALGGFDRAVDLEVGHSPHDLAAADFDNDGAKDLAVVGAFVSVLFGDGHGGFARTADLGVGGDEASVAVADFNGDRAKDVAVGRGLEPASIFLGDGSGGFDWTTNLAVGGLDLAVADFNSDGAADLAVADTQNNSVSILLGNGRGGFDRTTDLVVRYVPVGLAVADFNGDGAEDVAVATGQYNSVSVLLGDGRGGFEQAAEIGGLGDGSSFVVAADFNADGATDLAVNNPGSVTILVGDGLGGFAATVGSAVGGGAGAAAVSDLNHDGHVDLAVASLGGSSVSVLFNQHVQRADTNGSNRIDGFDVAAVARLASVRLADPAYLRNADVDLNGVIDGDDLALCASRFGKPNRGVSPLRLQFEGTPLPDSDTVTLQQVSSDADLMTVRAFVSETTHAAAGASFAITFDPTDGGGGQVLEVAGFDPGTYLSGAAGQAYDVDTKTPGMAKVTVTRLPNTDQTAPEAQPLVTLFLRARRAGQARLDFAPLAYSQPTLVTASGQQVPVTFVGGNEVIVDTSGGGAPGQQLGFSPDGVNFGAVDRSSKSRKSLRISNFGYSDLEVTNLTSTLPEFGSFFTSTLTVPPYGYIEMPLLFTPTRKGWFSGDLIIASNDATRPETRVPLQGESEASIAVVPNRLNFGDVAAGITEFSTLKLTNRGTTPLTLTSFQTSNGQFVPQVGFTTLDPGETGSVVVQFTPAISAVVRGTLTLGFDAPDVTTVVVGMVGSGGGR